MALPKETFTPSLSVLQLEEGRIRSSRCPMCTTSSGRRASSHTNEDHTGTGRCTCTLHLAHLFIGFLLAVSAANLCRAAAATAQGIHVTSSKIITLLFCTEVHVFCIHLVYAQYESRYIEGWSLQVLVVGWRHLLAFFLHKQKTCHQCVMHHWFDSKVVRINTWVRIACDDIIVS